MQSVDGYYRPAQVVRYIRLWLGIRGPENEKPSPGKILEEGFGPSCGALWMSKAFLGCRNIVISLSNILEKGFGPSWGALWMSRALPGGHNIVISPFNII